jgi:methyltransferase (TIGR00027 family)
MAFFRALESVRRPSERLMADSFAHAFLRPSLRWAVRLAKVPWLGVQVEEYADCRLPGARTSAIARTCLIDEAFLSAIAGGIRQIAILGSGFDCRAHRLPEAASATIFEVDHPEMLVLKEARLKHMVPAIPDNIRFAPIDFNRQSLPQVLANAGFNRSIPALFLWEGVTNYLSEDAVEAVLRYVGDCAPGSRIVFTYVHRGVLDGSIAFDGGPKIVRDVAEIGEPWTFGIDPAELPGFLSKLRLQLDSDAGAAEYRLQFYGPKARQMRGYEFYHVAIAHSVKAGISPHRP